MRRSVLVTCLFALAVGCAAETAPSIELADDPMLSTAVGSAKADGAFGSRDIVMGQRVTGTTSGDGIVLYAIELEANDAFTVEVERVDGDLRPSAYLYQGTDTWIAPVDYEAGAESVSLNFQARAAGTHHIIVRAYRGEGAGGFELATTCTGGPCFTGTTLEGVALADSCIVRASDCIYTELPRYNGRVGLATAQNLLEECLLREGVQCADACSASEGTQAACDTTIALLPELADVSRECLVEWTVCLDQCQEFNPFGYGEEDFLASTHCIGAADDFYNSCQLYIDGLSECGGSDYSAGTQAACTALCDSTEGAWDEGPFDGCYDSCSDIGHEWDAFIGEVADEAGEYVYVDESPAFRQVDLADVPANIVAEAQRYANELNAQAEDLGRTDRTEITEDEGKILEIVNEAEEVVGYFIGLDFFIDDPIFDGGGVNLYMNLNGDIISDETWSG